MKHLVLAFWLCGACGSPTGGDTDTQGSSGTSGTSTGTSGDAGAECPTGVALEHCPGEVFHCDYVTTSYAPTCVEYSAADRDTFEPLCTGENTWGPGCCDETGVVGQCLPLGYCDGAGLSFATDDSAGSQASCTDFGGTWVPVGG